MIELELSAQERHDRCLSEQNLSAAIRALREDGMLVIRQAVPTHILDLLNRRMDEDTQQLMQYLDSIGGNPRDRGHLQQGPPPYREFVFSEVAMNPYANQVSIAVLDAQAYLSFYNGNTNFPDSEVQHVHLDNPHLWPDAEHATPAYSLVVNIPLAQCTLQNGAIELWPGTHNICLAGAPDERRVDERRAQRPPVRGLTEKGDLMIRDARLWHRGVPNDSDKPRHMIALVHVVGWMAKARRLKFQSGCEEALEGHGLDSNAEYTEKPIDYLLGPSRLVHERRLSSMRAAGKHL